MSRLAISGHIRPISLGKTTSTVAVPSCPLMLEPRVLGRGPRRYADLPSGPTRDVRHRLPRRMRQPPAGRAELMCDSLVSGSERPPGFDRRRPRLDQVLLDGLKVASVVRQFVVAKLRGFRSSARTDPQPVSASVGAKWQRQLTHQLTDTQTRTARDAALGYLVPALVDGRGRAHPVKIDHDRPRATTGTYRRELRCRARPRPVPADGHRRQYNRQPAQCDHSRQESMSSSR